MGPPKNVDVRGRWPRLLLPHDHHLAGSQRAARFWREEASGLCLGGVLLPVLCLCEYLPGRAFRSSANIVQFGIGFQGVPWLYPTEINSLAMRTKGAAIATATNWM